MENPIEPTPRIRRAGMADFTAVFGLRSFLSRQAHLERPYEFRPALLDMTSEALFMQWLAEPNTRCLVAERGDLVIGYARMWSGHMRPNDWMFANHSAYIGELCVHPDHRGRGVGRALLRAIEIEANTERVEGLVLHVNTANEDARRFYQKMGYLAQGETRCKPLHSIVKIENP
jgi:ribosomal protein S18 acetylase RimI-like enzyme